MDLPPDPLTKLQEGLANLPDNDDTQSPDYIRALLNDPEHVAAPVSADDELRAMLIDWPTLWRRENHAADWLCEPIIAAGRAHAVFAPGGTGKSLFSLWLAATIATGRTGPLGWPITPRRVLYLDYEMTEDDLIERLEVMGYSDQTNLDNLRYALLPSLPPADTAEGGKNIARLAEIEDVALVIIDTFSRAVQGDENEADTVRSFYRWTGIHLKAAGRAFVRIDHAGKDVDKGQRGSSAKNDDVDVVWQMAKADNDGFTLTTRKRRMGWIPEKVGLVQHDTPHLRYQVTDDANPVGTERVVIDLDTLNVPVDASARAAAKTLRDAGVAARNDVIRAAQKTRKRAWLGMNPT